jgi:hypothetical protein
MMAEDKTGEETLMKRSSQDLPDIDDVADADIERVLGDGMFGKFAILESTNRRWSNSARVVNSIYSTG